MSYNSSLYTSNNIVDKQVRSILTINFQKYFNQNLLDDQLKNWTNEICSRLNNSSELINNKYYILIEDTTQVEHEVRVYLNFSIINNSHLINYIYEYFPEVELFGFYIDEFNFDNFISTFFIQKFTNPGFTKNYSLRDVFYKDIPYDYPVEILDYAESILIKIIKFTGDCNEISHSMWLENKNFLDLEDELTELAI